jgi:lipopolysaccharide/colanic/teichoic acid biosynthesis glycosyltransferase
MNGHSLTYPAHAGTITRPEHRRPSSVDPDPQAPAPEPPPAPAHTGALSPAAYERVKRGLDIALSLLGLIVLAPVFALIALAIKLQDGGPILYAHDRVGKGGRTFRFYKFRSMIRDADRLKDQLAQLNEHAADQRTFKMKRDPRITPVGAVLRRASLDELPQLFNILKGDMTLVGPRPPLPSEVELYSDHDRRRLEVTPGLTCLWQVRGRSNLPFSEQVKLDIEYIETRCLLRDLEILVQTVPAVLIGRGAY